MCIPRRARRLDGDGIRDRRQRRLRAAARARRRASCLARARGFRGRARGRVAGVRAECRRLRAAETVPAPLPRDVRRSDPRARRAAARPAAGGLPDARPCARKPLPHLCPGARRLVHDDGARELPRAGRQRRRLACRSRHRAARAPRTLAACDRQRVPDRSRAGAVGRRRDHEFDRRSRPEARRARAAPGPVPHRGARRRARSAPHQAALRDRRTVLRELVGPQGRDAFLDERERRRQVEARDARPRHPARLRLRRREPEDRPQRPAGCRAAARLRRRDRALEDLPGAPRRRARSCMSTPGWRGSRPPRSTSRAGPRSSPTMSPRCSRRTPTRPTPSSAFGTTASPRPARAWRRSSTGSLRSLLRQVPMA